jgi:triacylglycerol lipase
MAMFVLKFGFFTSALSHLALASPLNARQEAAPTAMVKNGTYSGVYNLEHNQDFFLGIPYAQPPVGALRFRNPVSLNSSWEGPANATEFSPACHQFPPDNTPTSEDCLTLNVVRPSGMEDVQLPVGVWIHGGAHISGSNRDAQYNMSFIVEQSVAAGKPFIGVNLNYRLQLYGFMYGSDFFEAGLGNLGYKDQHVALHWIQENIAAFGGDPDKVTIWGESAGGESVGAHLISYGGRDQGLFRAAIMESANPINPFRYNSPSEWDVYYDAITAAANCSSSADTVACLRTVPSDTLTSIFQSDIIDDIPSWGMEIDGEFIKSNAREALLAGDFIKVPILHGQNHDEGTALATRGIDTDAQFLADVRSRGADNATALRIADLYPDDPAVGIPGTLAGRASASLGLQYKRAAAFCGDLVWHATRRLTAEIWVQNGVPNWTYLFNVRPVGLSDAVGVTHFVEVAYVFSNIGATAPQKHTQVANLMSRYWASFIADSDPNSGNGMLMFSCFVLLLPPLPLLGHLAYHPQLVPTGQPICSLSRN